jgi:hypothetical protein
MHHFLYKTIILPMCLNMNVGGYVSKAMFLILSSVYVVAFLYTLEKKHFLD